MATRSRKASTRARHVPADKSTKSAASPLDIREFFARLPADRDEVLRGLADLDDRDGDAAATSRRAK